MADTDSLSWEAAGEFEDPSNARMSEVNVGAVHHRAGTRDHTDVVLTTVVDGLRRDTRSLPYGLVHPDAADPGVAAVAHDPLCDFRSCDDHDTIDSAGD